MDLKERMTQVEEMLSETLHKMDNLTTDVAGLKIDVATIKADMGRMQTNILTLLKAYALQADTSQYLLNGQEQMKADLDMVKMELLQFRGELNEVKGDVSQLKGDMVQVKDELRSFKQETNQKLDIMTELLMDMNKRLK